MPTGYTAGILDGEINTFEEFAKTCMRAFGATIHMRDEPLSKTYEPEKTSDYHKRAISKKKKELDDFLKLSDEELIEQDKISINTSIDYCVKEILKRKLNLIKLNNIIIQVKEWEPPTSEHQEFKNFMINQLDQTIRYDCDCNYYKKELKRLKKKLTNLKAEDIRKERIKEINEDFQYHTKSFKEEKERVNERNKWVTDLLGSINK
jgi:hypothetical protein